MADREEDDHGRTLVMATTPPPREGQGRSQWPTQRHLSEGDLIEDEFLLHPTEKKKMKNNERMTMPIAFACPLSTDAIFLEN